MIIERKSGGEEKRKMPKCAYMVDNILAVGRDALRRRELELGMEFSKPFTMYSLICDVTCLD